MLLLVLLQEIKQKFQWFRTGFFKATLKTQIFKWLKWKITLFPTNVYSDSSWGFLLFNCIVGYLNWKSIRFVFQTGEMLVDGFKHLEPFLANWSALDSIHLNAIARARKLSDLQLDNIFYKLLIVVRGFSITVGLVSPSLESAYQKITDITLMLSLTKIFVGFYPNYSKIWGFLIWSASSAVMQEGIPDSIQMFSEFFLALCYAAFGFWSSSVGSNWVLVKPSEVWHNWSWKICGVCVWYPDILGTCLLLNEWHHLGCSCCHRCS